MRVAGIVGHSGSGKTTLIEKLIPAARRRGLTVSTVKRTHHHQIELDTPGKDSFRHRAAGAAEVIVAGNGGWARITHSPEPASLPQLLAQLRPVDLVLVEGFKQLDGLPRVEVFRGIGEPLALADPGIAAVAAPADPALQAALQRFAGIRLPLDDAEAVLDFILSA
jgi:molybdopterin-guanine dinucleotide biosynthesis protein MobB